MVRDLGYYWYRFKWNLAERMDEACFSVPLHLDLELTNQCNLKCIMCPHGDENWNPVKGMMDYSLARRALIEARRMGTRSVKFNFRGEATLNKNLTQLIRYARYVLGYVDIQINTNLITSKTVIDNIAGAGLHRIIVSVDGATKETYEKIRVGGDWDKLIKNLRHLYDIKDRPIIKIQMTHQDANKNELEAFSAFFSELADEVSVKPVRTPEGVRKRCPQPFQRLVIAYDGTAFGCCGNWNDEFPIGKYPDQTLKDIWESQPARLLRRIARDPNCANPCKNCEVGASYK